MLQAQPDSLTALFQALGTSVTTLSLVGGLPNARRFALSFECLLTGTVECPSGSITLRGSAPLRVSREANVCLLFRARNRRHYAGFRIIPGGLDFELIGGTLTNIFPA